MEPLCGVQQSDLIGLYEGDREMKRMINGQEYEIPTNPDGSVDADVVRRAADIPPGHTMMIQRTDGSNIVINPGSKTRIRPEDHIASAPAHRRGQCP